MMGSSIFASRSFITGLVCQEALSRRMLVFSCQPGVSLSSYLVRLCRNSVITSASVFACVKAHHILPSVSSATNNDIRGETCLSVMVPGASVGAQILRKKRV